MSAKTTLDEVTRLRHVIETQRVINSLPLESDALMSVICERAQMITHAAGAVVELAEGDEMVYRAVAGSAAGSLNTRLKIASSLSGRCVRLGLPLICSDTETDVRVDRDACRRVSARSMIVVPLRKRDIPVGVLKVVSGEVDQFDADDVEILQEMAAFITDSLAHASDFRRENHNALHDKLTGLPNRHLFMDCLEQAGKRASRHGTPLAVFLIDLDGFKSMNDTYGHSAGDDVLRLVAHRVGGAIRTGDTLARLGGNEFVILCEGITEADGDAIRRRISSAVRTVAASTHEYGQIGARIGVAWRQDDCLSPDDLLAAADASMYRVKKAGRS